MNVSLQKKKTKNPLKKDPWKLNFIDKMLVFSNISSPIMKKQTTFKNFTLASFSIDTGVKIYADRVDTLYDFVFGLLEGLNSKKIEKAKKKKKSITNFRKKSSEKIIILTTKDKKFSEKQLLFDFMRKFFVFLDSPFFKKFFLEKNFFNSNKSEIFQIRLSKHKKKYDTRGIQELSVLKKINLDHFKFINFQENLQILDSKKRYEVKILRKNTKSPNSEIILLKKNSSGLNLPEKNIKNYFSINFNKKAIFQQKTISQKNNFFSGKKNKKLINNSRKNTKNNILVSPELISNDFGNFFLFLSKNYNRIYLSFLNIEFLFQKLLFLTKHPLHANNSKKNLHIFFSGGVSIGNRKTPFNIGIKGSWIKSLSSKKKKKILKKNWKKFNTKIIIQSFIFFLKLYLNEERAKATGDSVFFSFNNSYQKCYFVLMNSRASYQKVSINIGTTYFSKKKFLNFLICFLHSAFEKTLIFVGKSSLNLFYIFKHAIKGT